MEFSYNKYRPSLIASAVIFMSLKLFKKNPYWSPHMAALTNYSESQIRVVTSDLCKLLENANQ